MSGRAYFDGTLWHDASAGPVQDEAELAVHLQSGDGANPRGHLKHTISNKIVQ
jgi:hypothetical protein